MSKLELFFEGTDFTPLARIEKGKTKKTFKFICKKDNKIFNGDLKAKRGILKEITDIINDEEKQLLLLKDFLLKSQEKIDDLIIDQSLDDREKDLFDYHSQKMYFGGLVGVISIKNFEFNKHSYDITLQIKTRLDYRDYGTNKMNNDYFLMTLLYDGYTPLFGSDVKKDADRLTDYLLLHGFLEKYEAAIVKGYFKTYYSKENNDSRVKGVINVSKHISTNLGLYNGKITYSFKEKSEYNYINRLIVCAYEFLINKYGENIKNIMKKYPKLNESLETLKYFMKKPQYPNRREIINKTINILRHPYYTEYEELRKICLKILREEKQSPFSGEENERVDGVLVYVPKLWENYIKKFFRNNKVIAQNKIKVFDINDSNIYSQETIPDFVFYHNNKPFMILDAKFKPRWYDVATTGKIEDLLPDYDKCIRDMVSINAFATGVIFPTNEELLYEDNNFESSNKKYNYCHNISKFNSMHKFYTFPIFIPKNEGEFGEWKKTFIINCKYIFSIINKIIESNKI